jgi:hypothetical protein
MIGESFYQLQDGAGFDGWARPSGCLARFKLVKEYVLI